MFTQHQHQDESVTTTDDLKNALIMSGIPSNCFEISEFAHNGTVFVRLQRTFDAETNEFILARWAWIVVYDTRFLATTHNDTACFAIEKSKLYNIINRTSTIRDTATAGIQTYFVDHNLSPEQLTIEITQDYISTPETENTITISFTPDPNIPDETRELAEDGWNTATSLYEFRSHPDKDSTVVLSVAEARSVLYEHFADVPTTHWDSQHQTEELSI